MAEKYRFSNDLKYCYDESGREFFTAPFPMESPKDPENYQADPSQLKKIPFGGSNTTQRYFMFPTDNQELAKYQWAEICSEHSAAFRKNRCMILGVRKTYIRCPDKNKCAQCPYGRTPWDRKPNFISWDREHDENGFDLEDESVDVMNQAVDRVAIEELADRMDARDSRIMRAMVEKNMNGLSVREIAEAFGDSPSWIYQLFEMGIAVGKAYLKED